MKINGKNISGPSIYTFVLPIGQNPEDYVVFKFRPLTSKDKFEEIMPKPKPPTFQKPGGESGVNLQDPRFQGAMEDWYSKKTDWEFLRSISATEGLEWSKVKEDDPNTWGLWKDELEEHFGFVQYNRIFGAYLDANTLTEDRVEEARKRFLASQELSQ